MSGHPLMRELSHVLLHNKPVCPGHELLGKHAVAVRGIPPSMLTKFGTTLWKVIATDTLEKPLVPPQLAVLFWLMFALGSETPHWLATC